MSEWKKDRELCESFLRQPAVDGARRWLAALDEIDRLRALLEAKGVDGNGRVRADLEAELHRLQDGVHNLANRTLDALQLHDGLAQLDLGKTWRGKDGGKP